MRVAPALLTTLLGLTSLSTAAWASPRRPLPRPVHAGPPPAALHIDNDTGEALQVYVDGDWRGTVRRADERTFSSLPGRRSVTVTFADGHVLYDQRVGLHPHRTVEVELDRPASTLRVHNDGQAPLLVDLPGAAPQWLLPGTRTFLQTTAPHARVTTSVYGPRGLVTVGDHRVTLQPGRALELDVGDDARTHSTVVVTNQENRTVRVFLGGQEAVAIPSGATRTLQVAPGRHLVSVFEHGGAMLYHDTVSFGRTQDRRILIQQGRGRLVTPGAPVAVAPPRAARPAPPVRVCTGRTRC